MMFLTEIAALFCCVKMREYKQSISTLLDEVSKWGSEIALCSSVLPV